MVIRVSFKNIQPIENKSQKQNKKSNLLSITAITLATITLAELIIGKGKHIKNLLNKLKNKNISEQAKETSNNIHFENITQAKDYFDRIGIKTIFTEGSEKHLEDLNTIKDDLIILQKNGVEITKPNILVFSDWHKKSELKDICQKLNLSERATNAISQSLNKASGMWGSVQEIKDGTNIVFINNSFSTNYKKFIHEMGHLHQDLETSYWHSKGLKGEAFRHKQCEILGLPDCISIKQFKEYSAESLDDLFRINCQNQAGIKDLSQRINRTFPELNGNFETLFFAPIQKADGTIEPYYINAKKMVEKMHNESGVYAPNLTWENVAEIFEGLNQGKKYSDIVMLMYDFCGGGRVPNLIINGKKYDEYISSLYEDKNLISELKKALEIKKLVM